MSKPTIRIPVVGIILLAIVVVGCSNSIPSEANSYTEGSEVNKSSIPELTAANNNVGTDPQSVASICELMENPIPYVGKPIRVRTTFVRIGSEQWFGDESCVTRHPIFDAEFKSSFEDLICSDKTHFSDNLCKLVTPAKTEIDLAVTAVFSGHFDTYRTEAKFNRDGQRFRLNVENMASITDIRNSKKQALKE